MPWDLDPIFLLVIPMYLAHARHKRVQLAEARAAAMRRHPSARN